MVNQCWTGYVRPEAKTSCSINDQSKTTKIMLIIVKSILQFQSERGTAGK